MAGEKTIPFMRPFGAPKRWLVRSFSGNKEKAGLGAQGGDVQNQTESGLKHIHHNDITILSIFLGEVV